MIANFDPISVKFRVKLAQEPNFLSFAIKLTVRQQIALKSQVFRVITDFNIKTQKRCICLDILRF
jgi:hypothetical protein